MSERPPHFDFSLPVSAIADAFREVESAPTTDVYPSVEAARSWLVGEPVLTIGEQIAAWGEVYRSYRMTWGVPDTRADSLMRTVEIHKERDAYIHEFGFSVPNAEALDLLARHAPLIEVGAGSGFWSRLLQDRGIDIIATDPRIGGHSDWWQPGYIESLPMTAKAAVRRWPDRNVFCSWPSLRETWLRQAARAMRPGRVLLCVQEDACADERTWDDIETRFQPLGEPLELISFHHCHDRLYAWRKRGR